MAISLSDNLRIGAPKPVDDRYLAADLTAHASVTAANAAIAASRRHLGLKVLVGTEEYFYKSGIADTDLVPVGTSDALSGFGPPELEFLTITDAVPTAGLAVGPVPRWPALNNGKTWWQGPGSNWGVTYTSNNRWNLFVEDQVGTTTYFASIPSTAPSPAGLTGWTVTTGTGQPVVELLPLTGSHLGQQYLDTLSGEWYRWNGTGWDVDKTYTAGTGIRISGTTISATGVGTTNLTATAGAASVNINSDTGTDASILPTTETLAGLFLPAEKLKLATLTLDGFGRPELAFLTITGAVPTAGLAVGPVPQNSGLINGKVCWQGPNSNWFVNYYNNSWQVFIENAIGTTTYFAFIPSTAPSPVGLTGWTVTTGTGQPVVGSLPLTGINLGQQYLDRVSGEWYRWNGTGWDVDKTYTAGTGIDIAGNVISAPWKYRGEYNGGTPYDVGDVVAYAGKTFYRKHANGGNVGDTPSGTSPYWSLRVDNSSVALVTDALDPNVQEILLSGGIGTDVRPRLSYAGYFQGSSPHWTSNGQNYDELSGNQQFTAVIFHGSYWSIESYDLDQNLTSYYESYSVGTGINRTKPPETGWTSGASGYPTVTSIPVNGTYVGQKCQTPTHWWVYNGSSWEYIYRVEGDAANIFVEEAGGGIAKISLSTNLTINNINAKLFIEGGQSNLILGNEATLSLSGGSVITATLTSSTPCTITLPTVTPGSSFMLYLRQPSSGLVASASWTATHPVVWPGGIPPVITPSLGRQDILSFVANQAGTKWFGSYVQNFAY